MASPKIRRLRNLLLTAALLCYGLWLAGGAVWQLGKTAVFRHESVVVTGTVIDVRQRPFESWQETLGHGNWSMPGDVSYQPHVRFTLPGDIDAIRLDLPADNKDYTIGETISIISPPAQPGKAQINQWKFLWGASCLRLGIGSTLTLIGYGLLRWQRGKRRSTGAAEKAAPAAKRRSSPAQQQETPAEEKPKPKKPRKRKSTSEPAAEGSSTRRPRRRKKEESTAEGGEPKPGKPRSRKKKAEPVQGEFPF